MIIKRSIAIDGSVTSIGLEPEFWAEIERCAELVPTSWQSFLRSLVIEAGPHTNRSSAVREMLLYRLRAELSQYDRKRKTACWRLSAPQGQFEMNTHSAIVFAGRDLDNDIIIEDPEVSRKHVLLVWDSQVWWAVDLDSKNGTQINKRNIKVSKIKKGAVLKLGDSELALVACDN